MRARMADDPSQGAEVAAAISADSDTNEVAGLRQASLDEDDVGLVEALPGTCSPTPNPSVAAIVTLGSPQRPPINGTCLVCLRRAGTIRSVVGVSVQGICLCFTTVEAGQYEFDHSRESSSACLLKQNLLAYGLPIVLRWF